MTFALERLIRQKKSAKCAILLLSLYAVYGAAAASAQCPRKPGHEHIARKDYEELQRFVNDGHEPWRIESRAVAGEKVLEMREGASDHQSVYQIDLREVEHTSRRAIFTYDDAARHLCYRITLQRFSWLLPLAKKWEWMVWVPSEVSCAHC